MSPRWEENSEVRRGRSVVGELHVHLVFTTKYRRVVFTSPMLELCREVMAGVCEDFGADLRELNGEGDHVHLLVTYPPSVSVSKLVNSLKGVSSRRLRAVFLEEVEAMLWGEHFWSPSYFAGSCGGASLEVLRTYVEGQVRPQ